MDHRRLSRAEACVNGTPISSSGLEKTVWLQSSARHNSYIADNGKLSGHKTQAKCTCCPAVVLPAAAWAASASTRMVSRCQMDVAATSTLLCRAVVAAGRGLQGGRSASTRAGRSVMCAGSNSQSSLHAANGKEAVARPLPQRCTCHHCHRTHHTGQLHQLRPLQVASLLQLLPKALRVSGSNRHSGACLKVHLPSGNSCALKINSTSC